MKIDWSQLTGFEWDAGNLSKSKEKHAVHSSEAEEVLLNQPLLILEDREHSTQDETRWRALGQTNGARRLQIAFTVRRNRVRVISGRPMSRKERNAYEAAKG
jgi:uncharacterized DUF497 family protein